MKNAGPSRAKCVPKVVAAPVQDESHVLRLAARQTCLELVAKIAGPAAGTIRHHHEIGIPELPGIDTCGSRLEFASQPAGETAQALLQHAGIDRSKCEASRLELLLAYLDHNPVEADHILIQQRERLGILELPARLERIAHQRRRDADDRQRGTASLSMNRTACEGSFRLSRIPR